MKDEIKSPLTIIHPLLFYKIPLSYQKRSNPENGLPVLKPKEETADEHPNLNQSIQWKITGKKKLKFCLYCWLMFFNRMNEGHYKKTVF